MSRNISRIVRDLPKSGIRDFFEVVQTMSDVISLGIGEPDFPTPWHIREAAIYGLEKGHTGYSSNLGLPRLRRSIADHLAARHGLSYDPLSQILISVGVSESIDLALRAVLEEGDEVLYHEPCYVSYAPSIALARGVAVPVATRAEDGFSLTAEVLRARITPRSRVLMLNFPTNPTGAVLLGDELAKIAALCVEHDLLVLSDEIYCELIYDGIRHESIAALPGMAGRTVYLNGMSKAYAMTGFRIGYACGPEEIIDAMMKIHQYSILCAPMMGQEAAIEAIEFGAPDVEKMRREYERRRNFIVGALNDCGLPCLKPKGSFYVFPRVDGTGLTSTEFSLRLLREHRVAVVPGTAFGPGGEGYVRCSYATGYDRIKTATEVIAGFVKSL